VPVTYRGQAQLGLSPDIGAEHQRRAGWFILAANGLASNPLSATEALQEHKEQQGSEGGFRCLQAPLSLTSVADRSQVSPNFTESWIVPIPLGRNMG
jgi:hypothetical protein